jgi:hypothetical protein
MLTGQAVKIPAGLLPNKKGTAWGAFLNVA